MQVDVNQQYSGAEFNYVYIVACSFVVWLIIPGIGLLYSGLSRRKSALSLLVQCFTTSSVYAFPDMARQGREADYMQNYGAVDVLGLYTGIL